MATESRQTAPGLESKPERGLDEDTPRTILFANPKDGSGKTTVAMHVVVGLLRQGLSVGSLDLDPDNATLSRYIDNRRTFSALTGTDLTVPVHRALAPTDRPPPDGAATDVGERIDALLAELAAETDVTIIDTADGGAPLTRHALASADMVVTPIASAVDADLLGWDDPDHPGTVRLGPFGSVIHEEQSRRKRLGRAPFDWVVIRNRLNPLTLRAHGANEAELVALAPGAGFRLVNGLGDRAIFRDLFNEGLTVLDLREERIKFAMAFAHITARHEMRRMIAELGDFGPRTRVSDVAVTRLAEHQPAPAGGHAASTAATETAASDADQAAIAPLAAPPPGEAPAARRDRREAGLRHRILLVLESHSSRRGVRHFRRALRQLSAHGCDLTVRECEAGGEAERLVGNAPAGGFDAVVVAGGDRIVNEVAGGLANSGLPLAILPLGAGNAFAHAAGLSRDPTALARAVTVGETRRFRMSRVGSHTFSVAATVNLSARVIAKPDKRGPGLRSCLAAVWHGCLAAMRHRSAPCTVAVADRITTAAYILIANDRRLLDPRPSETVDPEGFFVCLCPGRGLRDALRYHLALRAGRLAQLGDVEVIQTRSVSVTAPDGLPVYADGERVTELPCQFSADGAAIDVVVRT